MPAKLTKSDRSCLLLIGKDITVTGIEDGHRGNSEELSAGSSQLNLWRW
jgi:hypothetical protein